MHAHVSMYVSVCMCLCIIYSIDMVGGEKGEHTYVACGKV